MGPLKLDNGLVVPTEAQVLSAYWLYYRIVARPTDSWGSATRADRAAKLAVRTWLRYMTMFYNAGYCANCGAKHRNPLIHLKYRKLHPSDPTPLGDQKRGRRVGTSGFAPFA